jgi:hypothetical protein
MKRFVFALLLIVAGMFSLFGQVFSTPAPLILVGELEPAPYEPEEFPEWAWGIRRFEVILFGSFPLMYMFSTLIYDFTIYAMNEFDQEYQMGTAREQSDLFNLAMISLSLSGAIAIIDLVIRTIKIYREDHAAADSNSESPPGRIDPD